jgi:hypothetical protein
MPMVVGNGSITGLNVGGLPAGTVNTSTLAAESVTTSVLANSSITTPKLGYTGSILQCVRDYDDTVAVYGGGAAPNYVYLKAYYITLLRANSTILVEGILCGHTQDDSSVFIQYNVNGGSWVGPTSLMNSQAYTYSGLGDMAWTHESNEGPFPHPIHNFVAASSIGATAGSVVGFRMGVINETSTTNFFYNRGLQAADNSVNMATARSFMTLWELAG